VGTAIPIQGSISGVRGRHKLVLQRFSPARHRWVARAAQRVRSGAYVFPAQYRSSPGWVTFRTVLHLGTKRVGSNRLRVQVLAAPAAQPAPAPAPAPAPPPPATPTCANTPTVANCIKPVGAQPAGAEMPDIRIKDLTRCGAGDMAATNGTCFMITHRLSDGHKMLKFGVITYNVGAGPAEIAAHRDSTSAAWVAYQNFYDTNGVLLGSVPRPGVQFFYAGDQHSHWHVVDFDSYDLYDASDTFLKHGEKHGYCMQDNAFAGDGTPIYAESTSCGKNQPYALTIVHGLSPSWGDTYPTSLPDQGIDIEGLPDGTYTVRVHADAVGAVTESDESNNTAEVQVVISGDTVTVVPGSSRGGI
jgi:hypothetical protein